MDMEGLNNLILRRYSKEKKVGEGTVSHCAYFYSICTLIWYFSMHLFIKVIVQRLAEKWLLKK